MNTKKLISASLAGALVLTGAAFAETDLEARIAELEAQVALYKPFYDAQVVAEYDGGVVMREDAMAYYAQIESMYTQYGISLADYGYDSYYKQDAVQSLVKEAVIALNADALGLSALDEETMAGLEAEAETNYESYIASVLSYFLTDNTTEEDARAKADEYLASMGYAKETILEGMIASYVADAVHEYITKDVAITEEDVQAAYDELVAQQQESYTDDRTYNNDRDGAGIVAWNPEGYRAVKHVLIKFSDEQNTRYNELNSTIKSLNSELDAVLNPTPTEEPAEDAEASEEETEAPRAEEEIRADLDAAQAELDALYGELLPTAQEVIEKFNNGTAFEDLIAEYNEDPGMSNEPTATIGYAVAENSTTWDPAFTAGAMSIAEIGGISEPVYGMYGIHILYYMADVPAGPVALEEIHDALETKTLNAMIDSTYSDTVDSWVAAANPVYFYENMN